MKNIFQWLFGICAVFGAYHLVFGEGLLAFFIRLGLALIIICTAAKTLYEALTDEQEEE